MGALFIYWSWQQKLVIKVNEYEVLVEKNGESAYSSL